MGLDMCEVTLKKKVFARYQVFEECEVFAMYLGVWGVKCLRGIREVGIREVFARWGMLGVCEYWGIGNVRCLRGIIELGDMRYL